MEKINMNKTLAGLTLGAALAALGASQALAADLYGASPAYAPATAGSYDWSGFYLGVHGGLASDTEVPTPLNNASDWLAGVQAGADFQVGGLVVGGSIEASYAPELSHDIGGGNTIQQEWSGAAKARAGLAVDRLLAYGTAGVAVARLEGGNGVTLADEWATGYVLGGGVEYAVFDNVSVNLEYNQTRFDDIKSTVGATAQSDDLTHHAVRAGLNFRF
jgi:outer membrane immunogenic protein